MSMSQTRKIRHLLPFVLLFYVFLISYWSNYCCFYSLSIKFISFFFLSSHYLSLDFHMILFGQMHFCFQLLFSYPWALTLPIHNKYDDPINLKMQTFPSCLTHHSYFFTCLFHCCSVTESCLSEAPWTAACQPSLSFTVSLSFLKLLDCKEILPVHSKGNQSWIFIGKTDAEVEAPIFWPPDAKSWFIWKDPDAGKVWGWEEKGMAEDEMVGWHQQLNGHGFGWTQGVGDGQGGLACCGSWGRKELDMTERLNWTELILCYATWPSHSLSYTSSLALGLSQYQGLFQWVSSLHQVAKVLGSFSISSSNEYSGLISFRVEWFELLAVWGTLKEFSPAPPFKSISSLVLSLLYAPTFTSIHHYWKSHSFDYTDLCWQSDVSAFKYTV